MRKLFVKSFALVVATVMLVSCYSVFAADSDGLKEAILVAKDRITIPQDFEFDSNFNTRGGVTEYYLNWYDDKSSINVTVNSYGDITDLHYYINENTDYSPRFSKYTDDEIKKIAMENVLKLNPKWESGLSLENTRVNSNNIYDTNTYVVMDRYVNGIPFLNDSVRVSINNQTGILRYFTATWSYKDSVPNPELAMDVDSAAKEFFKLSPLELVYEKGEDGKAKLYYIPTEQWVKINARKGGKITEYYRMENGVAEETVADAEAPMLASGGGKKELSENELANISEVDGLLTEQELINKAQAIENTGLDTAKHNYTRYNRRNYYKEDGEVEKTEYNASLGFIFNHGTDNEYSGSVTFDAKTGELLSYYAYDYRTYKRENNKEEVIASEDAQKIADLFAKKYSSEEFGKTKAHSDGGNGSDYVISYIRYENDIPYKANYISVDVNSKTGKISSFNKNWEDEMEFEAVDRIIDTAKAEMIYKLAYGFDLTYVLDYSNNSDGDAELCYTLGTSEGVRRIPARYKPTEVALSGAGVWKGDYPTDISGHYAEEQIKALMDAGVIERTMIFKPEDIITKGELTDLVTRLKGNYGIEIARETKENLKIILPLESYDDNAPSQRADGVMYIIRALGYGEIAELSGIYNHEFADEISDEISGYAALAKGLKIVRGDENGAFNATAPLSKADAAIMIYNYLAR